MILKSDPDCAVSKPEERLRSVVYDLESCMQSTVFYHWK